MTRLNVEVAVRWASGVPDQILAGTETFQNIPMLLVLSVTDGDGAKVENLSQDQIHVGYQYAPEPSEDSLAVVSDFNHIGPTFGGTGWYSCILHPQPTDIWGQDEVFLCVTVRRPSASGSGQDKGQALTLARYRQIP